MRRRVLALTPNLWLWCATLMTKWTCRNFFLFYSSLCSPLLLNWKNILLPSFLLNRKVYSSARYMMVPVSWGEQLLGAPKWSLHSLLHTSTQSYNLTGHLSHYKSENCFSERAGFARFFSRSLKMTSVLDEVVARTLPTLSKVWWNFHNRAVNTVFETIGELLQLLPLFWPEHCQRGRILRQENLDFRFVLPLFRHLIPYVDFLYARLQKGNINSV